MIRPALAAAALLALPAAADDWTARKCLLYTRAWNQASAGDGLAGVGRDFVAGNEAFIASGCHGGSICPGTPAELALADRLTLMAVAEGMTGSFLPFACPQ